MMKLLPRMPDVGQGCVAPLPGAAPPPLSHARHAVAGSHSGIGNAGR